MSEQPAVEPVETATEPAEREWWDDPALPWRHKPTRSDIACWTWITVAGIYGIVMLPLRAWLLTVPYISALLTGSRAALVAIGAYVSTRHDPVAWWLPTVLFSALSALKWDWLYWWAGKLWGHTMIEVWTANRPRYQAWANKLEGFTRRHPIIAMILTYLPLPLVTVVYVVMGASGVKLRTFLLIDYAIALANAVFWFALGVRVGPPAVHFLEIYTKYATYVAIGLLVVMVAVVIYRARKQPGTPPPAQ